MADTDTAGARPTFLAAGDTAFVVQFAEVLDPEINRRVRRLDAGVRAAGLSGIVDTVPTMRSLMVHYDPIQTSRKDLEEAIDRLLDDPPALADAARLWRIPVCYEGEHGPDLAGVARTMALSEDEVVRRHTAKPLEVFMMGFLPGFPYVGLLPEEFDLPRLVEPRVRVPPRSISLAQRQTTIYTVASPGGWHLLGRSPVEFFDLSQPEPILFAAGDRVWFQSVGEAEYDDLRARVEAGTWRPEPETYREADHG
jgi:inhibitor of KinA